MLAALGMFVFDTDTALFDELARRRAWRHEQTARFGTIAASQFVGPGDDQVTLSGSLVPGLAGRYSAIERLVEMAQSGDGHQLADGTGRLLGTFVITALDEGHKGLLDNGLARRIEFSLTLQRVA